MRFCVAGVKVGCSLGILNEVGLYFIFTRSRFLLCGMTRARYEEGMVCSAAYGYLRCALISPECEIRSQPVRLPMRCSAVISAGYERALGGSQICIIWLPSQPPVIVFLNSE